MAAKDYKICLTLFDAYIAKVSKKNPNLMLNDRRKITDNEIFSLISWKMTQFCTENNTGEMIIEVNGKPYVELKAQGELLNKIKEHIKENKKNEKTGKN